MPSIVEGLNEDEQRRVFDCVEDGERGEALMAANIAAPKWVIPELVVEGLNSLAGRPKVGKTLLALQMAKAVCSGGTILGRRVETPAPVLLISREMGLGRLKKRMQEQGWTKGAARNLHIHATWPPWEAGGRKLFLAQIDSRNYKLVIADTLLRLTGRNVDPSDLRETTALYAEIQEVSQAASVATLPIAHHRKRSDLPQDPIEDLMGSTASTAGCEHILGLYRRRVERTASLYLVGYDLEDEKLSIIFDGDTLSWELDAELRINPERTVRDRVLELVRKEHAVMTIVEIADALGRQRSNITAILTDLCSEGSAKKVGRGRYQAVKT